jgi:hypothetical protein
MRSVRSDDERLRRGARARRRRSDVRRGPRAQRARMLLASRVLLAPRLRARAIGAACSTPALARIRAHLARWGVRWAR